MAGPESRKVLCLTIFGYRKPGMSQPDYENYMTTKHAPLVRDLMAQYGILSYTQVLHVLVPFQGKVSRVARRTARTQRAS